MKTLIIDNYDSFTYNLFQYVAELGGNPVVVRNDAMTLDEIRHGDFTHIVISPGPGSPDSQRDFGVSADIILHLSGVLPILGICLGHQGIIHYLGGKVVRAPKPVHGKKSMISLSPKSRFFDGFPHRLEVMRYHSLIGEKASLPSQLRVNAMTDDGLIMGVEHVSHPTFGIQFHPESIGTAHGKDILRRFLSFRAEESNASAFLENVLAGKLSEEVMYHSLIDLKQRQETVDDIVGMARVLRSYAERPDFSLPNISGSFPDGMVLDVCGTGGSGLSRMNISTTSAFVLAACGVRVAKHGNRAASGRCGSFDLLEKLGIHIAPSSAVLETMLTELRLGFIFAPTFHPGLKAVSSVRKKIGSQTIFNLLGPLVNPFRPTHQLIGTSSIEKAEKIAHALLRLGTSRACVVSGEDGLDEVTLCGKTSVFFVHDGAIDFFTFHPSEVGMEAVSDFSLLAGGDSTLNSVLFEQLLQGTASPSLTNLLLVNAAFGLFVADFVRSLPEGVSLARQAITSGKAHQLFQRYRLLSHSSHAS